MEIFRGIDKPEYFQQQNDVFQHPLWLFLMGEAWVQSFGGLLNDLNVVT